MKSGFLAGQIVNGRVNDKLSVSRALGDSNLAPFVSPLPDVFEHTISKYDEFMILASDGIWDVMTPEDAVRLIVSRQRKSVCVSRNLLSKRRSWNHSFAVVSPPSSQSFKEPDAIEAKLLAELVKDEAYNRGSKDNISVVVVLFPGFSRLKRGRKKSDIGLTPGGIVGTGLSRSPSTESHKSVSVSSDLSFLIFS